VEAIRDAVELPYLLRRPLRRARAARPKGILLYGPPGCGKTMIAKAVANSLAQRVAERTGQTEVKSYFLNVKGPELLNKYVGETERQIRLIFQRAREKSAEGFPVIVFFDEMESLFRTRGSGVSSDVETTIVPQLLAEIDGVESLKDVVVIGASNREDMIDPAILRPGRLDVKIKVDRPNADAAREIFKIYLHERLPLDADEVARPRRRRRRDDRGHDRRHRREDVRLGARQRVPRGHLRQRREGGPVLQGLQLRRDDRERGRPGEEARDQALHRGRRKGLRTEDLRLAIRDEFRENEDLPNTTNPDDWARISGKKGERIVYVRTLISGDDPHPGRSIENVSAGQYL
jgi:proteasome-associated ATPase